MGRYGMYYRASLPSFQQQDQPSSAARGFETPPKFISDGLTEIESGSVLGMTDSSSAALLKELNEKKAKILLWPFVLVITILATSALQFTSSPLWLVISTAIAGIITTITTRLWDQTRKSVVLFYNFDDEMMKRYERVHGAFDLLATCRGQWQVEASGATTEWKYNAGAGRLIRRKPTRLRKESPPYLKTNISVPVIPVGRQSLYFFPDRLLVYDQGNIGAVSYETLQIDFSDVRFIESEGVPGDAQVVDQTWQYVNKKGGPDRRFSNNRELPIALYEYVSFASATGLNELVSFSRTGVAVGFREAISQLVASLNRKEIPPALLRITPNVGEPKVVELKSQKLTIGKSEDNNVVIENDYVSHHHAIILADSDGHTIQDLNSTNGTQVNGKLTAKAKLRDGDAICLGNVRLQYVARAKD